MALSEFSLIDRYFKTELAPGSLGVGDDAAVLPVTPGRKLVVCKDLLLEGRHFFSDVCAESLGYKSLAVNLSDLAAMGSSPIGCLLGLGIPSVDEDWLAAFSTGFREIANRWGCPLIGGDTVFSDKGIFISVTALGELPVDQKGLLRSAAKVDDDIWVSGPLGAPDIAVRILSGRLQDPHQVLPDIRVTLERPQPRVGLGQSLLGVAHAAIDISDGLAQDLGHVLKASGVGAVLDIERLPVHPALKGFPMQTVNHAVLHGGDVYELCFTAPVSSRDSVAEIGKSLGLNLVIVGKIQAEPGLFGQTAGQLMALPTKGFDHFAQDVA